MIELKEDRPCLTAIHTRVFEQVLDDMLTIAISCLGPMLDNLLLAIRIVGVVFLICGTTRCNSSRVLRAVGSPGRGRTYNRPVNSRVLSH